ncbi:MAG TPA: alpha/beta fold hydrolase [Anditalea sp.]|nr:alpha/beta fold hydrolase [Anditalea sp.]
MIVYLLLCGFLYVFQESLIFFPQKLEKHYQFDFDQTFDEIYVQTEDDVLLHSLLFKVNNPRGVIFYLHGNAGSLLNWSSVAKTYNDLYYDVYLLDYRGYGKSAGAISGEEQFYRDIQTAYDTLRNKYNEDKIVVLGYSIGTGPATKLAADNRPALLILQAPYYSLTDLMRNTYPFIPTLLLKYKFPTYQFIQEVDSPIVVFHGTDDDIIYHASSLKLKEENQTIEVILLEGQGHNGITQNTVYQEELKKILP